jgi:hypothetical protein
MLVTLTKEAVLRLFLEAALALTPGQCISADLWGFKAGAPLNLPKSGEAPQMLLWEKSQVRSLTGGTVPEIPIFGVSEGSGFHRVFVCSGPEPSELLMVHEVGHVKEFLEKGTDCLGGKHTLLGIPNSKHLEAEKFADRYLFSVLKGAGIGSSHCEQLGRELKGLTARGEWLAEASPTLTGYPRDSERVEACKAALTR